MICLINIFLNKPDGFFLLPMLLFLSFCKYSEVSKLVAFEFLEINVNHSFQNVWSYRWICLDNASVHVKLYLHKSLEKQVLPQENLQKIQKNKIAQNKTAYLLWTIKQTILNFLWNWYIGFFQILNKKFPKIMHLENVDSLHAFKLCTKFLYNWIPFQIFCLEKKMILSSWRNFVYFY